MEGFRSGYVNIIGFPNVGKSTLLNKMIGENLSITSPKIQTTRQRILGIVTSDSYQMIISDTPGILNPEYELQKIMKEEIEDAIEDADVFLYVVEAGDKPDKHLPWIEKIKSTEYPCFLIINKIDLSEENAVKAKMAEWEKYFDKNMIVPLSAKYLNDFSPFLIKLSALLPVHEPYFPVEDLTDKTERFIAAEKIREQSFFIYKQEIPYSIEVEITSFKDEADILKIHADIFVSRKSQKHIVIGKAGSMLKKLGIAARKELESFFGKQVYLELYVRIKEDWQNNRNTLQRFGYR